MIAARHETAPADALAQQRHAAANGTQHLLPAQLDARDAADQRARVRMGRLREHRVDGAFFHDLAGIEHRDPVADFAHHGEIVTDEEQAEPPLLPQPQQQRQELRFDFGIERRGRLIEHEQRRIAGESHRDERALTHAAAELVLIGFGGARDIENTDIQKQGAGDFVGAGSGDAPVDAQGLGDLLADPKGRIERCERILKYRTDSRTQHAPARRRIEPAQVAAFEQDLAGENTQSGRQQIEDGCGDRALSRAGFADEPQRLASADPETNTVNDIDRRAGSAKPD